VSSGALSVPFDGVAVIQGSVVIVKVEVLLLAEYMSTQRFMGPYGSSCGRIRVLLPPSTAIPGGLLVFAAGY